MKYSYQLKQTLTDGREARYSSNGVRISRIAYDMIMLRGQMHGQIDCFLTECKQLGGGKFRRVNYVSVRY